MIQSTSSPLGISPLPGPATSPGAHMPTAAPSAPLQPLPSPPSPAPQPSANEQAKRDLPWKYEGYKAFSAWMASEDDFFIFRRFENLNALTMLWMQDKIVRIEAKLQEIHKTIEDAPLNEKLKNCSFRWDEKYRQERHALMGELSRLLHHYNQYIEAFSKVRARPRAEKRQITNVRNWLAREAIDKTEASFTDNTSDLISINSRTRPPLGQWLESLPSLHLSCLFRAKPVPGLHHISEATSYSSNTTFECFTNTGIILVGLAMLLAPMWWLEYVSRSETRLKIITGFVGVFSGTMTLATVNRPFEVVAATAAYAAVLMVFMQIDGRA